MGYFRIEMDGQVYDTFAQKSRKGAALIRFLVVQRGRPVSSQRLIRELEADSRNENPRNAMKTLVSRTRSLLNQISPGLGSCIASEPGTYRWQSLPGVTVDVLEILDILDRRRGKIDVEQQWPCSTYGRRLGLQSRGGSTDTHRGLQRIHGELGGNCRQNRGPHERRQQIKREPRILEDE